MTRIIVSMWTTLDGFVAGPDDSMDWLRADADLVDYETGLVESAGALLLGRTTHADFASYWPAVASGAIGADEDNRRYARRLDELDKFVASRSGDIATWSGSRRLPDVTPDAIQQVKDQVDGDVIIYGSLSVIAALAALNLIDEFHLIVNPTLIGDGRPLLDPDQRPVHLDLLECRPFAAGAVLLRYAATSAATD